MTLFSIVTAIFVFGLTNDANACFFYTPIPGTEPIFKQIRSGLPYYISDYRSRVYRTDTAAACAKGGMTDQLSVGQLRQVRTLCEQGYLNLEPSFPFHNVYWFIYPDEDPTNDNIPLPYNLLSAYYDLCTVASHNQFTASRVICYRPPATNPPTPQNTSLGPPLNSGTPLPEFDYVDGSCSYKLSMAIFSFSMTFVIASHRFNK